MSETENTDDVRMRHMNSKTSNIVVYVDSDADDARDVAVDIGGDEYAETEVSVSDTIRMSMGDADEKIFSADYSDLPRSDTGEVSVSVDRTVTEDFKRGTGDFTKSMVKDKLYSLVDEVGEDTGLRSFNGRLEDSSWNTKVRTMVNDLTTMGLVYHKPDVEQGMVWEDEDAELWAFTITVECKDTSQNTIHLVDDTVVNAMVDWLNEQSWVDTARKRACEVEQTERGDCYNVFN